MDVIAREVRKAFDGAAASANVEFDNAKHYKRFQFEGVAAGGTWTAQFESSRDEGATWIPASGVLTLASVGDSIFLSGQFDRLRLKAVRTAGTLNGWIVASDNDPSRW
mgnify:CR=1 FL=1